MKELFRQCGLVLGIGLVLMSPLPIGFQLSWVDFTFGAGGLDPQLKQRAVGFFLLWIMAGILAEYAFRRGLLLALSKRMGTGKAVFLHLVILLALYGYVVYYFGKQSEAFALPWCFVYELILQLAWTAFFLRTGSALATGLLHGGFSAIRFTVMNDIAHPFDTLYFYTSSHPGFYMLLFTMPLVAVALTALIPRRAS